MKAEAYQSRHIKSQLKMYICIPIILSVFNIFCENQFEDCSYKRLNKKQLGKEGKRKIKAHEAQPLNKSDMNLKSIVVRIVKKSCNQAHCRNLGSDGYKPAKCSSGAF